MKKFNKILAILLTSGLCHSAFAQTPAKFSLNGLGRTIISNDRLTGNVMDNFPNTADKGTGGYAMFDLYQNLSSGDLFKANLIMRVRSPFGTFWGVGTKFEFRQFQLTGRVGKNISWQIGDINVGNMTGYTVYNADTEYNEYESELFRIRRNILRYENFNFGNSWRLQGAQAQFSHPFNKPMLEKISGQGFVVRTNATNNIDMPDRIMGGARLQLIKNKNFYVGGQYTGLLDIPITNALVNYKNNVWTADAQYNLVKDAFIFSVGAEAGFSNFDYYADSTGDQFKFNDNFYDANASFTSLPLKLKLTAGYKMVGPNFTSPAAQTTRLLVTRTPLLFPDINGTTGSRPQTLYDRFTDEQSYMRAISPVLLPYNATYDNITPYGPATPNRKGINISLESDTSMKKINFEVQTAIMSEIIGEGIKNLRSYLGIRGGIQANIHEILGSKRRFIVSAGGQYQSTQRSGDAPVDLTSLSADGGISFEILEKVDLMAGMKMVNGNGNEYVNTRDNYNRLTAINATDIDLTQMIYSGGVRLRITEASHFTLSYNLSQYTNNADNTASFNINQLFTNLNIAF